MARLDIGSTLTANDVWPVERSTTSTTTTTIVEAVILDIKYKHDEVNAKCAWW
jgi:hypothetical protein